MSLFSEIIRGINLKKPKRNQRLIFLLFSIPFGAGGLFLFWSEFLSPLLESRSAQNWEQTHALVLESRLEYNEDSTHIRLRYSYQYAGKSYENDRYELSDTGRNFSTSEMELAAKQYPVDSEIPIWLNPANPQQSAVVRDMVITNWIALPFSIPFIGVGFVSLFYALFCGYYYRRRVEACTEAAKQADRLGAFEIGRQLSDPSLWENDEYKVTFLKRENLRAGFLLFLATLFWNGILSVFLLFLIFDAPNNELSILLTLFLSPFVLIGLGLLYKTIKSFTQPTAPDYVIISEYDPNFQWVDTSWLLLTERREQVEFQHAVSIDKESRKRFFREVKQQDTQTIYHARLPEKEALAGKMRHEINSSKDKNIELLIYARNKDCKSEQSITLYTDPSD